MWSVVPIDLVPPDWIDPVSDGMIYMGVFAILAGFFPNMMEYSTQDRPAPMTPRDRRIWRRIQIGILVVSLGLIVGGTLIQFYWL